MLSTCKRHDYLPVTCSLCSGTYCKEHGTLEGHSCPLASSLEQKAIVCPLCKLTLRLSGNEDANQVWNAHFGSSKCASHQEVLAKGGGKKQRARCAAAGCREQLGPTNTHSCSRCSKKVCLTHRHSDSHECARAGSFGDPKDKSWWSGLGGSQKPTPAYAAALARSTQQKQTDPRNTLKGSADRRKAGGVAANAHEILCPFCNVPFPGSAEVTVHVNTVHAESGPTAANPGRAAGVCRTS
jgi:hypothetical protein